uniref:AAA+ ATPase domain-containing protein n=1 Tax=viral metagenome TaxID=1070528 RepID=A0A6C0JFQ3_9ZZZZ
MKLSNKQQLVFEAYQKKENIFLTGAGGTGKTELIRHIVKDAIRQGRRVQVCALTGCASILLKCNAKTIHSWSGVGLCNGVIEQIVTDVSQNNSKRKKWNSVELLIIDEVSMMSRKLFDVLNMTGKMSRRNKAPFGGIQIIFSGDFNQLSPIGRTLSESQYCFESDNWNSVFHEQIELDKVFRQSDPSYIQILSQVRSGKLTTSSVDILNRYVGRQIPTNTDIKPTIILPTRAKVESINKKSIDSISETPHIYRKKGCSVTDTGCNNDDTLFSTSQKDKEIEYLMKSINSEDTLFLKRGAQVMCVANLDIENGIVNGSQGVVIDFTAAKLPVVTFYNGITREMGYHTWQSENIKSIGVKQIPLMLSWAITIHKAQGATIDVAQLDIGKEIFACGQTYVALSRIKSLDGLYLTSFDPSKIKINRKVVEFYNKLSG